VSRFRLTLNQMLFRSRWSTWVQLLPALLIITFVFLIPLVQLFAVSLWEYDPTGVLRATDPTAENYLKYLRQPFYRQVITRTLRLGFITSTVCLLLAYPLAYILARMNFKHKSLLMFLLITPLFVSVVVRVFGWIVIMDREGVVNYVLQALHITKQPLRILKTEYAVVVGLVNVLLAFMVMPIYSSLESIRPSLEEAAQTLGASPIKAWLRVTLPLSIPGVLAGWTLAFIMTLSSYVQPSVLGGPSYFVMATVLRSQITGALNWPMAAATGFTLLAIGLVAVYVPVYLIRRVFSANLEEGSNRG